MSGVTEAAPLAPGVAARPDAGAGMRIGVDVGGTFTKAVAIEPAPFALVAEAVVPTSHEHGHGVTAGVAAALEQLLDTLGDRAAEVELVAFSTTQAMNALLEGDVPRVGVIGLGAKPDLRRARKRTKVGTVGLAPGRDLETEHVFLDLTHGLDEDTVREAVERLAGAGCEAVAVSGAFAVESPEHELRVSEIAAEAGLPACCGHQLSGAYGLETRTVSATVNAAILPAIERTAGIVESAIGESGLDVPLLVLRGDAGAMDIEAFRRRPSFTVGSGPAAGVAAALHQVGVADAIVVEVGGTSTNVSVVSGGRPLLRSIKVMGRPTAIRSIDSWVVGVAGGSMVRLGRKGVSGIGPRSAHGAGLPYACFAVPADLAGCRATTIAPRPGDRDDYAVVEGPGGRFAVTATCAANALGVIPAGAHSAASRDSALAAFAALGERHRSDGVAMARAALDAAVDQIEVTVREAVRSSGVAADAPIVALGGAGEVLVPELCGRNRQRFVTPEHGEVLASVGAAMTLIRVELERSARVTGPDERRQLVAEAEFSCVEAGAAPGTITVETVYDSEAGLLRAIAVGAVALETGAAGRSPLPAAELRDIATSSLQGADGAIAPIAETNLFSAYATGSDGDGRRAAIIDRLGGIIFAGPVKALISGRGEGFMAELAAAVDESSLNLGLGSLLPQVTMASGSQVLDLSDARSRDDLLAAARAAVEATEGVAVAAVRR